MSRYSTVVRGAPDSWASIAEAIREVQHDAIARDGDGDWFDPTDSKWWSECPQIGDLDPSECAEAWNTQR